MPFWGWSKTAASNANSDPTINWAEGMAPSAVNDSARAMGARLAEWRDDISGTITTGGTGTAYTVASNQVFDTLAHMNGAMIAFVPHTTCGATVTLNVDGLGAKPLRTSPVARAASRDAHPRHALCRDLQQFGCGASICRGFYSPTLTPSRSAGCSPMSDRPRQTLTSCCRSDRRSLARPMRRCSR